ncbi:uncharacterized protein [Aristolochia californica]|uniref:uncharacterized protein n=1 Tax=Aristolochia californica TaxID=171875 RepID=UPI0035DA4F16
MAVYVVDIVITDNDHIGIQKVKKDLNKKFQTKDLGLLKYILGMEVLQPSYGIVLSQRKNVLDLLQETWMLKCKPVDTPMEPNVKFCTKTGSDVDVGRFQRLVDGHGEERLEENQVMESANCGAEYSKDLYTVDVVEVATLRIYAFEHPDIICSCNANDFNVSSNLSLSSRRKNIRNFIMVIDFLIFNGTEELGNIVQHYKQRHHIIGGYVIGHEGLVQDKNVKDQGSSETVL